MDDPGRPGTARRIRRTTVWHCTVLSFVLHLGHPLSNWAVPICTFTVETPTAAKRPWNLVMKIQTSLAFPRLCGLMETCQTRTLLFRTQLMPSACVSDVQNPIVWRTSSQRVMTAPKHCLVLATFVMRPWRGMKSLKDLGWRQVLTKTFPCYGLAWTSSATTTTGLDGVSASIVPRLSEFRQQWCGCLYRYRTCAGWTEYFASGKGTCNSNSKTYKSVWIWVNTMKGCK